MANPYDTNSLLGTPLEELTWSDIRPISIEDYSGFTARQRPQSQTLEFAPAHFVPEEDIAPESRFEDNIGSEIL